MCLYTVSCLRQKVLQILILNICKFIQKYISVYYDAALILDICRVYQQLQMVYVYGYYVVDCALIILM